MREAHAQGLKSSMTDHKDASHSRLRAGGFFTRFDAKKDGLFTLCYNSSQQDGDNQYKEGSYKIQMVYRMGYGSLPDPECMLRSKHEQS
jgi:hypothetical protein